ncbi:MAG: hypothetical protein ACI4RD_06700 [Kiritimatiellia bacterium]
MSNLILFLVVWVPFLVIGQCARSEYCVPISGKACRENKTPITNVVFDVLSECDRGIVSLTPSLRSCIKFGGNGEIHFADLDCIAQVWHDSWMEPVGKYYSGKVKLWRVGNSHEIEADHRGGGRLLFKLEGESCGRSDAVQMAQKVVGSDRCVEKWEGKCFFSSGVRRLTPYLDNGTLRTYLKTLFDRENWFTVSYVLWVEDEHDENAIQKLLFSYDIVRVDKRSLSSVRKGALPISVRDKSASHADGVRIAMTERAEWNYDLDIEFEGMGCQIRIFQHSINEAVKAWNIEATRMSNRD